MDFIEVGTVVVRREYRRGVCEGLGGEKASCIEVVRDCGMGCKCEAYYPSRTAAPTLQLAIDDVLCFNDSTNQGISGRGCSGRVIQDGPDVWIFEIDAKLKEGR